MTTLTPPCKLASPANQCRIDYVLNQVNHKDFEFPSVSWTSPWLWSCGVADSCTSSLLSVPFYALMQKRCHVQSKFPWLQCFDTLYLTEWKRKLSERVLWREPARVRLFFSIVGKKKMIVFGDRILASAQLFPKLMAFFSVCLICRFAWSVSRSDSVISEHASIWEPVSWTSLSPETDSLPRR